MVPLVFQLAALILLSFSSPPKALMALSMTALVSVSAAGPGLQSATTQAIANTAPMSLVMRVPRLVREKGRAKPLLILCVGASSADTWGLCEARGYFCSAACAAARRAIGTRKGL